MRALGPDAQLLSRWRAGETFPDFADLCAVAEDPEDPEDWVVYFVGRNLRDETSVVVGWTSTQRGRGECNRISWILPKCVEDALARAFVQREDLALFLHHCKIQHLMFMHVDGVWYTIDVSERILPNTHKDDCRGRHWRK